jgi:hypothetical protein
MVAAFVCPATRLGDCGISSSTITVTSFNPTGEAYPGTAPVALILSSVAGRRSRALIALASFVSLTSMSPRTTAKINFCSSPARVAMRNTALAVREAGTFRKAASSSILLAPGVATFSTGRRLLLRVGLRTRATWRLAE